MALEKATKSAPFVEGPDTKTDPKLSAKPAALFNSRFRNATVSKRPGRDSLSSAIQGGGTQTEGEALFPFNEELVRINGGVTYGLAEATDKWAAKPGGNNYARLSLQTLVSQPAGTGEFDHCILGGIGVVAWVQSGLHVAVYDVETGTFYQGGELSITGANTTMPRLVAIGRHVVVLAADFASGNLLSCVIDADSPTTSPSGSLSIIRTDVYTSAIAFDAIPYNSARAVVAYPTTINNMRLIGVDTDGLVTTSPATASVATGSTLEGALLVQRDTVGRVYVVFADPATDGTSYLVRSSTFGAVLATTPIVTNTNWNGLTADFGAGASIEASANLITVVLCSHTTPTSGVQFLGTAVLGPAGVTTAFSTIPSTVGLFVVGDMVPYDGTYVFPVVNTSFGLNLLTPTNGLESSAYVINLAGYVVAKGLAYQSRAGPSSGVNITPGRVCRGFLSGQTAKFLFWQQGRAGVVVGVGGTIISVTALSIVQLSVTNTGAQPLPIIQVGRTKYVGGAYPRVYDGLLVGETGFQLSPCVAAAPADNGAGNLSAGTYQWKFLYSWVGANGELIRGIVTPPTSLVLAATRQADMEIGSMPLAMRDRLVSGGQTRIEVYRTVANGTVFYRQSSLTTGPQNDDTSTTPIVINDNTSDADLQFGELLYTTGGILDWEPPPAYSAACAHNGRLVVLSSEDPYAWWPSSIWVEGETVRFSSFTAARVPADTGPLVNCASLDGKLILFTTGGAYLITGDGPDQLGGNPYPPPTRIASVDEGPLPGTPLVSTPQGIMYQGPTGISLLDRGLNCSFIGADVQLYTTGLWHVKSAVLDAANQEVRFLADSGSDLVGQQSGTLVPSIGGVALVYNYYYQQWDVDLNYGGQSACFYQKNYTMVRSDGVVWTEAPLSSRDDGAYYSSVLETPWIKVAGPQGFQRLWYATVLGTYASGFTLKWEVAFDYAGTSPTSPVWTELVTWVGPTADPAPVIGGPLRVRHHIGHKCEAVKFRFTDINIEGDGAGMALTDLSFEFGVKRGVFRLPAAQTA